MTRVIWWTTVHWGSDQFLLAATEQGLWRILHPQEPFELLDHWVRREFPGAQLVADAAAMAPYSQPVQEYLAGRRQQFTCALTPLAGTPFQRAVWGALQQIPYGETRHYAAGAQSIGHPGAARAVGAANRANPLPLVVPCHRVIGQSGHLR